MLRDIPEFLALTFLFLLGVTNVIFADIYLVLYLFSPGHPLLPYWNWMVALIFNLGVGTWWTWEVWRNNGEFAYKECLIDLYYETKKLFRTYSAKLVKKD